MKNVSNNDRWCKLPFMPKRMQRSGTVMEIFRLKHNGVTTLTFWGHVTSSVTWPFDLQWANSYGWSIVTIRLSSIVIEMKPFEVLPGRFFQERRSIINYITLISYTPLRYVRNIAREKWKKLDDKIIQAVTVLRSSDTLLNPVRTTERYLPYRITQRTRHRWTHLAITPARQAGRQSTYRVGMVGWVGHGAGYISRWFSAAQTVTHPSKC